MRPIELSIRGLHSFREEQTVDFKSLCGSGVFGIFGPTGSGKSSLLDAMTLSLYGKVERATNTHGILNQAEDTLYVGFTFELGQAGKAAAYKVERSYKRSGRHNMKTSACRLIDISSDKKVIADKAGEVTKEIETLLGLSIDDFTRAVVLPQGKFADFLMLRGSERRLMLQRLFNLEKYGDELNKKIRNHLLEVRHQKDRTEAEQAGLGDASTEAVKIAEEQFVDLDNDVEKLVEEKTNTQQQVDESKKIRDWQKQMNQAQTRLESLKNQEHEITEIENKLKESAEAASLLPFAEAYLQDEKEMHEWKDKLKKASAQREECAEKERKAREALDSFNAAKEDQVQKLQDMRQRIDNVEKWQKELEIVTRRYEKKRSEFTAFEQKREDMQQKIKELDNKEKKYSSILDDWKKRLKDHDVSHKYKRRAEAAKDEKLTLLSLEERWREYSEEAESKKKRAQEAEQYRQSASKKLAEQTAVLKKRFQQIMSWYEKTEEDKRVCEKLLASLIDKHDFLQSNQEEQHHQEMAARLASDLIPENPCPVCGSEHHPYPAAQMNSTEPVDEDEDLDAINQLIDTLERTLRNLDQRTWFLQNLSDSIHRTFPKEEGDIEKSTTEISTFKFSDGTIKKLSSEFKQYTSQMEKEQDTLQMLHQKISMETTLYEDHKVNEAHKQREWERLCDDAKTSDQHAKKAEQQLCDGKEKWKERFSEFHFETIIKEYEQMQHQEEELEKIRNRMEEGNFHLEQVQIEKNDFKDKHHALQLKITEINAEVNKERENKNEYETSIKKALGSFSIEEWKSSHVKQSEDLKLQENQIKEDWKEMDHEFEAAETNKTVAENAWKNAEERYLNASQKWRNETHRMNKEGLAPAQAAANVLETEKANKIEQQVSSFYKEKENWLFTLEEARQKVKDNYISEEHWNHINHLLTSQLELIDKQREKRGAAWKALTDLKEKKGRYEQLENTRTELIKDLERYQKLDQVFRGKGFVEFLAEEQLIQVSRQASERLKELTRGRYAIEVDSEGGFIIRDDANGGVRRPVTSLSGGETFLTSLALALSLSTSIQLKGEHPLEFFFLDEGFGTLDHELLETVMTSLEKLQTDKLAVGIISHVPELQDRLPKKLHVYPAEPGGAGTTLEMSTL
ncbi:AAA family ATPase [Alteribacillus sp. HJP-4]|uniref:AAA family ATPase n=1 Tax=Alteribacillus sp. HJP-4 TaxID=2775394 RepID=UPI0035CD31B3